MTGQSSAKRAAFLRHLLANQALNFPRELRRILGRRLPTVKLGQSGGREGANQSGGTEADGINNGERTSRELAAGRVLGLALERSQREPRPKGRSSLHRRDSAFAKATAGRRTKS